MATLTVEYRKHDATGQSLNTYVENFADFGEMDDYLSEYFMTNLFKDAILGTNKIHLGLATEVLHWLESEAAEPLSYDYDSANRSVTMTFEA